MAALKSIVLIISLCNLAFALEATNNLRITKKWSADTDRFPYLTKVNNDIVIIRIEENIVQITYPPEMKKSPCHIPLEVPENRVVDPRIWAQELGNGKFVITTGKLRIERMVESKLSNLFIVVNPSECTAKNIEIPGMINTQLYQRLPVAFDDMFDVFPIFMGSKDSQLRKIKRYTDDGKEIIIPDSISSDNDFNIDFIDSSVYPINPKDPSAGYLVITNNMEHGYTILSLLNSKLELTKKIEKKGVRVRTASTSFNSTTICYVKQEHTVCELLDKDLNTKFEIPMMQQPGGKASKSWAANLSDGGAMVVLQHEFTDTHVNPIRGTEWVHIQRIFKDGSTSNPLELDKSTDSTHRPRGFVMGNGEYCAGNIATKWSNEEGDIRHGKFPSTVNVICVDIKSE